ncbi:MULTISPECIES: hypothetical protein [unclassified Calothrix]|nr:MULTISPECIES: hypothetical protein [unclassified Calothrix]
MKNCLYRNSRLETISKLLQQIRNKRTLPDKETIENIRLLTVDC